jgi:hypothetical protein
MSADTLTDAVYGIIFPDGKIPIECKDNIQAIDARITEIQLLAVGKYDGSKRAASKALTEQIIQLRESCTPPMNWKEIARRVGRGMTHDAVRNRYHDAKAAERQAALDKEGYAAISGAPYTTPPEVLEKIKSSDQSVEANKMINATLRNVAEEPHAVENLPEIAPVIPAAWQSPESERPTTRESPPTQEPEKVKRARDLTPSEAAKIDGPRIPHKFDDAILIAKENGKSLKEITEKLQSIGIDCTLSDVTNRVYQEKNKREAAKNTIQPTAAKSPSQPGVEGARDEARANPRGTPEEKNPEPKAISRYELNAKIWELHKAGKAPKEISDSLCSEGFYYGEQRVRRMLMQQGAEI